MNIMLYTTMFVQLYTNIELIDLSILKYKKQ